MSVYVELVLFNNFAIDVMLMIATSVVIRKRISKLRVIAGAICGSIVATIYAVAPKIAQIAIKVLLAPFLTLIFCKTDGIGTKAKLVDYVKTLLCFCLLTYFTGGVAYGISMLLNVDVRSYWTVGLVALAIAICLFCARVIAQKKGISASLVKDVEVCLNGRKIALKGLCDSGNLLVDDVSGLPIAILSQGVLKDIGNCNADGIVSVKTIGGEFDMTLVKTEGICVGKKNVDAYLAISPQTFDGYDIILQNSMF